MFVFHIICMSKIFKIILSYFSSFNIVLFLGYFVTNINYIYLHIMIHILFFKFFKCNHHLNKKIY